MRHVLLNARPEQRAVMIEQLQRDKNNKRLVWKCGPVRLGSQLLVTSH